MIKKTKEKKVSVILTGKYDFFSFNTGKSVKIKFSNNFKYSSSVH